MNWSALPIIANAIGHAITTAAPSALFVLAVGVVACWVRVGRRHG
jgi:hypothetical protein